jgi:hypothetical protein
VGLPAITTEVSDPSFSIVSFHFGSHAVERGMNAIFVVIVLKTTQFSLEIASSPKRNLIEQLAPYRPDESFNEGMR